MYEEYLEKLKEEGIIRNRKEGTIQTYTANVNKFLNWADKNPEELTLDDCRNYIWELRVVCKFSTQHCNGVNSALKFFFRYVLRKSWDQDIVPRMINDIVLPRAITLEEVKKLIDSATSIRNKAIIALLYSSSLRVSELCRLEFGDIYFSTNQVHIRGSKNHQDHWTILSETAKELLAEYWRSYPVKRQYVFVASKGRRDRERLNTSGVQIMLRKVTASAGFEDKVTPHTLRHSFATHMVEQGECMEYIQAMMGHRDPASTHKYVHVANKSLMGIKSPLDAPAPKKRGRKKRNG